MTIPPLAGRALLPPSLAADPSAGVDPEDAPPLRRGLTALGPFPSERVLRDSALVLSSMSIGFVVHRSSDGALLLLVDDADYEKARENIDRYEEENRDFPPQRVAERARYSGFPFVALGFVLLVAFAWITGPLVKHHGPWFREGTSVASLVTSTEPFRAVTALTLHADGAHVLGNLLSGTLFGRAVERRLGPGSAALSILASGALGNAANAAFHLARGQEHASLGASTAVFGAVGILATTQLLMGGVRVHTPMARRHWTDYAAPFVGGLALLGSLGASPESDVWAHAFGFAAGLFVAVPFAFLARRYRLTGRLSQSAAGATALGVIVGAWMLALR